MKYFLLFGVLFFVLATLVVLIVGVVLMGKGGKLDAKFSNKLMVARVCLQAMAIIFLGLLYVVS